PVALGFKIAQPQLRCDSPLYLSDRACDFARHELEPASRTLVIKQDASDAIHSVGFAIVPRQIESGHFADAVRAARMKRGILVLRRVLYLTEHFTRSRKVEAAFRPQLPECGKHVVSPVDVGVHGREAIGKALGDKALGGEMITLVKIILADDVEDAWITLEACRM